MQGKNSHSRQALPDRDFSSPITNVFPSLGLPPTPRSRKQDREARTFLRALNLPHRSRDKGKIPPHQWKPNQGSQRQQPAEDHESTAVSQLA